MTDHVCHAKSRLARAAFGMCDEHGASRASCMRIRTDGKECCCMNGRRNDAGKDGIERIVSCVCVGADAEEVAVNHEHPEETGWLLSRDAYPFESSRIPSLSPWSGLSLFATCTGTLWGSAPAVFCA